MRRKKKFTSALSFVLSLLMAASCVQPVMATQTVPDVESVSEGAAAQAEGNKDTNVSVSEAPAKEETSEAPAEESDSDSESTADTTETKELESESSAAAEPAALSSDSEISPLADTNAYAILYESGEMVFQRGSTPDASKGNVLKTYTGFETKEYDYYSKAPWYENRTSVKSVSFKDVIKPVSTAWWFCECNLLTDVNCTNLDTSAVTDMTNMFYSCSALTNLDVSSFDTSAVTDMSSMFYSCSSLTSLDLSSFDTSAVTSMTSMFYSCSSLTNLDVSSFDTSAVTSMYAMFNGCSALTSLDLSSFDTKSVTYMGYMFVGCRSLTSLDLSSFDTSAVTDMSYMFGGFFGYCRSLTSLDLSSFNTSAVTDMRSMFNGCSALTNLDVSSFDTSAVTDMSSMFYSCSSLTSLDLSSFDTSAVTSVTSMFYSCSSLTSLDLSSFNTSAVTSMRYMFYNCNALTSLDVSSFDTSAVTDMYSMFDGCSSLTSLNVSSFDTSAVTSMSWMFSGCNWLKNLDLSSFNTSAVTNMGWMFYGCSAIETLTLGTKFAFKGDTKLVDATWRGINTGKEYTTSVLTSTYDGPTMADTYMKCFDIKFDAMGGKSSESKKSGYIGMAFDSLPTAEKRGYDFVGWFTQKQGGTQLLVNQPITQSTYYAQYTEHKYTITVTNDVAGTMGDKTKDFTFQLKMTGNTPAELPYTKGTETGTLKVTDGVVEFTLSDGESITFGNVLIDTAYKITEVDGASNGYTVESTNSSGTLTGDANVSFTNTRNGTVPTSAHTNILISIGVFAIALAGLFWHLHKRKQ